MVDFPFFKNSTPDSNDQLRRHILWMLLSRVIFFTLLIGISVALASLGTQVLLPPLSVTTAFLAILFVFSIGSSAMLQKSGLNLKRFGLIQFLCDTFFAALLVYGTGCSQSIFTPVFILPVITGGLIMYRIGGFMSAAAATILYGGVLFLEYTGFFPQYLPEMGFAPIHDVLRATNLFAVYGTTFFITALLSGSLAARLRVTEKALHRTSYEFDRLTLLYKQIFDDISTGIITTDNIGTITSFNSAAKRITGYPPEDVLGSSLNAIFPTLDLKKTAVRQVVDLKKRDGATIRAGYSFSRLNLPSDPEHEKTVGENCKVITLQDISAIEKMEKRVREAEKMAAIGELSASIAHDFRNPLAAISGSAQLLALEDHGTSVTGKSLSTIILRESKRMAKTINDFLQFARPAPLHEEWFDLRRVVQDAIGSAERLNNRFIQGQIELNIPVNLDAFGDRQQIQTILTHLLENSANVSTEDVGPITVSAAEESRGDGNAIRIEVTDQGPGIDAEIKDKIFQPFFSTRENGTGLGLAIVQQIVEHHGGEIQVLSEQGKGCSMHILIPLPSSAA